MALNKEARDRFIAVRAYVDAKHNMTTAQIKEAIEVQEDRVRVSKADYELRQQVLFGYRRALVERGK